MTEAGSSLGSQRATNSAFLDHEIISFFRLSTKIQAQAFNTTIPWNLVLFGACPWISSVATLHFEKLPLHNLIAISSFSRCVNNSTNTKNS